MNTSAKFARLGAAALFLAALGVACDFGKTANQAQALNVVVATLLQTPPLEVKLGAIAGNGLDASIPSFDGGFTFDGGFSFDGGTFLSDAGITVPPQTIALVFFGERQTATDVQPKGILGATVTLTEVGGGTFPLAELGGGSYQLTGEDGGFKYKDGATYDFTVVFKNETFVSELEKAPSLERIAQFHPAAGYIDQVAGQPFKFIRPDPPTGEKRPLGFVQVYPITSGGKGEPTFSNVPKTPLDFLKLIAADQEWKATEVTIPGTAFPERDHNYVIILQSAKLGGPKTENLFSGSAILGGTAEIGIVKTAK